MVRVRDGEMPNRARSRLRTYSDTPTRPLTLRRLTWSKALDDDQVQGAFGTFYGGNPPLDPNNLKAEYGRSDIDVRNRFVGSVVYQPALFRNTKIAQRLVDGWIFAGTATEQTGFPIVALLSGFPSGGADGGVTGGVMSSGSGTATAGRPPQIARNSQPGPGIRNSAPIFSRPAHRINRRR